jgi:hypothetical protein
VRPRPVRQAIERALVNEDQQFAQTRWSDALSSAPTARFGGIRFGGRLLDSRTIETDRPPKVAFAPIERIGGRTGYYHANWLWQIRGMLDRLVGGVGLRRGRRHPHELRPGDAVDFWRVEAIERPRLLRLVAEMRLPGRAWLQFEVEPTPRGSLIRQTALFDPIGLTGLAYWYGIWPLHQYVFGRMLASIARA